MPREIERLVQNKPWLGLLKRPHGPVQDPRFLAAATNVTFRGGVAKPRDGFQCANPSGALGGGADVTCIAPLVTAGETLGLSSAVSCVIATEGVSSGSTVSKLSGVPTQLTLSIGTLVPGMSNYSQEWQGSATEPTVYAEIADMLVLANGANGAIKVVPVSGATESLAVYQLGIGSGPQYQTSNANTGLSAGATAYFPPTLSEGRYKHAFVLKSSRTGAVGNPRRNFRGDPGTTLSSALSHYWTAAFAGGDGMTFDMISSRISNDGQYDTFIAYRCLRYTGSAPGRYYKLGEAAVSGGYIADSGADGTQMSDAVLVQQEPLEEFVNYPPRGRLRLVTAFKNRLWGVTTEDPNFVWCTDVGPFGPKPDAWPLLNFVPVNVGDGDEIRAIHGFQDRLLIFKRRSIWELLGDWPKVELRAISFRPDGTGIGTFNQYSVAMFDDLAVFAFYDGLYVLQRGAKLEEGLTSKKLSTPIDDIFTASDLDWTTSSLNRFFRLAWDRTKRQLWVFYPTTGGTKAVMLTRDAAIEGESAWSEVHISAATAPTYYSHAMIIESGDDVLYVGDGNGYVFKQSSSQESDEYISGGSVVSTAINWQIKTIEFPADGNSQYRLRRFAWGFGSAPSSSDTLYYEAKATKTDGSTDTKTGTLSGAIPYPEVRPLGPVGRRFQLTLSGAARDLEVAEFTADLQRLAPGLTGLSA